MNPVETYSIKGLKRKREMLRLETIEIDAELRYRNGEEVQMTGVFFQGEWYGSENTGEAVRIIEDLYPDDPSARYKLVLFYRAKSIPVGESPEAA